MSEVSLYVLFEWYAEKASGATGVAGREQGAEGVLVC